jgi:hypothetical protein
MERPSGFSRVANAWGAAGDTLFASGSQIPRQYAIYKTSRSIDANATHTQYATQTQHELYTPTGNG